MTTPGATEAVTPEQRATDHERIWLEPNCAGPARTWCEDNAWPAGCEEAGCDTPPTQYIRADLVGTKVREAEANALRRAAELADTFGETILCMWDRPGGPPGNGYVPLRGSHVASAIRSLLPKEAGK